MRRLLGVLIVLAWASECSAYSSIAYGYSGPGIRFVLATDASTAADAQTNALRNCRTAGLLRCGIVAAFENTCMSVASTTDGLYNTGVGLNESLAQQQALSACIDTGRTSCAIAASTCDGTPSPKLNQPAVQRAGTLTWSFFFRFYQAEDAIPGMAKLVLLVCCLWIFVSIVSSTPSATLKWRASLSAWVALPAAAAYAISVLDTQSAYLPVTAMLYLWTDVFAAFLIGGELRRRFSVAREPPRPLSLPLAVLAFTILSAPTIVVFVIYGLIPEPADCPILPDSPLSICGYFHYEGLILSAALFIFLIVCGAVLPADSTLVLAYDRLNALIRKLPAGLAAKVRKRRIDRAVERSNEILAQSSGPYPVPAIYQAEIVDKMCLKLKRSQRSGVFGKPIFLLDARMEVTAEEAELVRRYGLGDNVIYESSSRQRRKEATLAHLEMTKGGPGFTEPTKSQLLGAGKTLYRLARAGMSATAAALSLHITVRSLMSGVHVECKSMDELLDAERAIVEAAQNLRSYLNTAATFDGREEIIEF